MRESRRNIKTIARINAVAIFCYAGCGERVLGSADDATRVDAAVDLHDSVVDPLDAGDAHGSEFPDADRSEVATRDVDAFALDGPCERSPSPIVDLVSPGLLNSYAVTSRGCIWGWGLDPGQFITPGGPEGVSYPPTVVPGFSDVRLASNTTTGAFIVVAQGVANMVYLTRPWRTVRAIPNAVHAAAGISSMCAVLGNGSVRCIGEGHVYVPRDGGVHGDLLAYALPTEVPGLRDVIRVYSLYDEFSYLAVRSDGTVVRWVADLHTNEVPRLTHVANIVGNEPVKIALMEDGSVRAFGACNGNVCGMVDGATVAPDEAVVIPGLSGIVQVAISDGYSAAALRSDGRLVRWGRVRSTIAGGRTYSPTLEVIPDLTDVVRIGGGLGDIVALKRDGSVWALHLPTEDGVPSVTRVPSFGPP